MASFWGKGAPAPAPAPPPEVKSALQNAMGAFGGLFGKKEEPPEPEPESSSLLPSYFKGAGAEDSSSSLSR